MKNEGMPLHKWIATGHDPKDYEGAVESAAEQAKETKEK